MKKNPKVVRLADYKPKKEAPPVWGHLLILIAVSVAVYYNSINNGFVGDDIAFVKDNASIRSLSNIPSFFYSPRTLAAYDIDWGTYIYRPLRTISYALDFAVYGKNAWGFHLTNLILHIIVSATVYFVTLALFDISAVALIAGVVFAIHPVHVEAVSWISSRADLIGLIFLNLSLLSYFKYRRGDGPLYLPLSLLLSFISYLGKETMIPLPGFIILYDYAARNRRPVKDLIRSNILSWFLFSAVCLGYLVLRFHMTGKMSSSQGWWGGSAYSNFLMMAKATATYLWLMVAPFKLTLHYLIKPVWTVFDGWVMASLVAILASFALIAYEYRKNRMVFFSLLWFYLALVPIANIVPISFAMMAERYIYMPSMGPIIAISYGIYWLYKKAEEKGVLETRAVVVGALALGLAYGAISYGRNVIYKDDIAFYKEAIRSAPDSAPSYNGLGDQYYYKKDYENALLNYGKAIAIDPNYADAYMGTAYAYMDSKNMPQAIRNGETAASIKPDNPLIRFQLGNIYREAGMMELAAREWKKAVELNPAYSEAYNNLGIYYQLLNDYPRAVEMYESSLKYNPFNTETYYNAGVVSEAKGDKAKAAEFYSKFMKMAGPDYKDVVEELRKKGY